MSMESKIRERAMSNVEMRVIDTLSRVATELMSKLPLYGLTDEQKRRVWETLEPVIWKRLIGVLGAMPRELPEDLITVEIDRLTTELLRSVDRQK